MSAAASILLQATIAAAALLVACIVWAFFRLVHVRDSVLDAVIGDDPWEDDR